KSAQIREILISESAWEEMTCLFAPSKASIKTISTAQQESVWRSIGDTFFHCLALGHSGRRA
ncbi:hypothetical protein MGS58_24170, partial [Klebsiella pneumoniae]|nr:hypothetical protein [Klebsiella pneumoniae]